MFESKKKHSYIDMFEGIIIGGSLAAAATFLFGTKKGKELQKKVVNQYKKLGRTTKTMKGKIEKMIKSHTMKKIKRAVKSVAKKVAKKTKPAKKRTSSRKST